MNRGNEPVEVDHDAIWSMIHLFFGILLIWHTYEELINYFTTGQAFFYISHWRIGFGGHKAAFCYTALAVTGFIFLYSGIYKIRRLFKCF